MLSTPALSLTAQCMRTFYNVDKRIVDQQCGQGSERKMCGENAIASYALIHNN